MMITRASGSNAATRSTSESERSEYAGVISPATLPPALAPALLAAYVLRFHAVARDPVREHA